MQALLALTPILLILGLMVGMRWSAATAGLAGLAVALAVALGPFGYGSDTLSEIGPSLAVAGALAEALFVAATILWIIFPALCIYELQLRSGAFSLLRASLTRLTDDRRMLAILVAWFFALFLEGAAGFGTPVALAAPVLVGLGFAPLRALTLVLIGHAAGVSFGAIGTPVLPQIAATGLAGPELARATAVLHGTLGWILLAFVFRLASGRQGDGQTPTGWLWAAGAAALFLAPFMALAIFAGPELPTLGGALVGGLAFVAILRRGAVPAGGATPGPTASELLRAALPYLVLLALILLTRLVPAVGEALRGIDWSWTLADGFSGSMQPLYHPGTMLMIGFVAGALLQGRGAGELRGAAVQALRRLPRVVIALAAMLALARLMVHAGMIEALAGTAAGAFGEAWPWAAPAVGVLGTFVTGSATASNILLTDLQVATAEALGLSVLWLTAAQSFGAAVGNIVCPHNIVAGAATVGLVGREGEILRRTVAPCAVYAAAGGALVFILT